MIVQLPLLLITSLDNKIEKINSGTQVLQLPLLSKTSLDKNILFILRDYDRTAPTALDLTPGQENN